MKQLNKRLAPKTAENLRNLERGCDKLRNTGNARQMIAKEQERMKKSIHLVSNKSLKIHGSKDIKTPQFGILKS